MRSEDGPLLVVAPNIGVLVDGERVFMDIKAADGVACYAHFWPGKVRCLGRQGAIEGITYGQWYNLAELPFEIRTLSANADGAEMAQNARDAAILTAGADLYLDLGVVEAMAPLPVVMIIEYTLRTRLAINRLSEAGLLKRLRTSMWLRWMERGRRKALSAASGIQANGWPAFAAYGPASPDPLLYFDTRLRTEDLISGEAAAAKAAALTKREPLRLAFSGRLERMKGADHLIPIARMLQARNCAFSLDIYGEGSLRSAIQKDVEEAGLGALVHLHGPVDFQSVLVPSFKESVDLFLCCHPQGDPSCTYLETLGCGVPILGYLNEAWDGLLRIGTCGAGVRVGDDAAMVGEIVRLDLDRAELGRLMVGAAKVAESRSFEKVYAQRIQHLWSLRARRNEDDGLPTRASARAAGTSC
jgi:glycosyltransferase involved in cell wall biosynthesis